MKRVLTSTFFVFLVFGLFAQSKLTFGISNATSRIYDGAATRSMTRTYGTNVDHGAQWFNPSIYLGTEIFKRKIGMHVEGLLNDHISKTYNSGFSINGSQFIFEYYSKLKYNVNISAELIKIIMNDKIDLNLMSEIGYFKYEFHSDRFASFSSNSFDNEFFRNRYNTVGFIVNPDLSYKIDNNFSINANFPILLNQWTNSQDVKFRTEEGDVIWDNSGILPRNFRLRIGLNYSIDI